MTARSRLNESDSRLAYEVENVRPDDIDFERVDSEEEDYESGPTEYEIATYPADFTLEVLHEKWKKQDIEIPPFQRQFVWRQVQASKLIESFLVGLPVPAVFLYTERKSQKFLVIDGQQRLRSVFYFFEGYFGEEVRGKREVFELRGLSEKSKYAKKTYENLDEADQRKLKNCVLRSFVVQQLDPSDDTSIYHIFERLNTGGTLLANQEVRNCVYRGAFNALLHELNLIESWRSVLGKKVPDTRQRDVELVLRFFALLDMKGYEKPMKDYLNRFMRRNRDASPEVVTRFRTLFSSTCELLVRSLGSKPFHVRTGLNAATYDCVMVAFARNAKKNPPDIQQRYENLLQDQAFLAATRTGTTDVEALTTRFSKAEEILFGK